MSVQNSPVKPARRTKVQPAARAAASTVAKSAPKQPRPAKQKRPIISNRRVAIRYPLGLASAAQMSVDQSCIFHPVRVFNISTGGIALILRHDVDKNDEIYVQLTNRILDFTYDIAAKVAHSELLPNGRYLIGFSFARELTLAELAGLL